MTDDMADRGAEAALLGCLLRIPAADCKPILEKLPAAAMTEGRHRYVLDAVRSVVGRDVDPDELVVASELRRLSLTDRFGGQDPALALVELAGLPTSPKQAGHHLDAVLHHQRRRDVWSHAVRLQQAAESNGSRDGLDEVVTREVAVLVNGHRPAAARTLRFTPASGITPERVTWLWDGRIPAGKVSCVDGHPGLGKSTLLLDLAARASAGRAMPDGSACGTAGDVLILSAEDDAADTIVPRLIAADADLDRVHVEPVIVQQGGEGTDDVSLPLDIDLIDEQVARHRAVLVVIDPFSAYVDGRVDLHKDQDSRSVMRRLKTLAAKHRCAVVLIRHLTKTGGTNATMRGQGSVGIVGAARAGLLVAEDPDDDSRVIVAPSKRNLAPGDVPALAYRLNSVAALGCARVVWDGPTAHRAEDLLAERGDDAEKQSGRPGARAREFLREFLDDGPQPATAVWKAADREGVAERTLKRVKNDLSVRTWRPDGPKTPWFWALPGHAETGPENANSATKPVHGTVGTVGSADDQHRDPPPILTSDNAAEQADSQACQRDEEVGTLAPLETGSAAVPDAASGTGKDARTTDGSVAPSSGREGAVTAVTADLRGAPKGEVTTWELERLVRQRPNQKRRTREKVTLDYCADGWNSTSGTADEPYSDSALCQTLLHSQWTNGHHGLDVDRFHAFHHDHPVVWRVRRLQGRHRLTSWHCDPELPDEYRQLVRGDATRGAAS